LPDALNDLVILRDLIPGGLDYGINLLVEFEPDSIWFEASFAIAADALKKQIRTDYHTWTRPPDRVRQALNRFGLDLKALEQEDLFRINDSYTSQTGLGTPEIRDPAFSAGSVKIPDLSIVAAKMVKNPEAVGMRRLHIDDNNSALTQYNDEKAVIDYYRTRIIPESKARELAAIHSLAVGVHSDSFYKQFELFCDGIIDFKSEPRGDEIEHFTRTRLLRGKSWNSRWRSLRLSDNGAVTISD
jgi:KaiC/GvpD/RAD55 family RecA-like ATPase